MTTPRIALGLLLVAACSGDDDGPAPTFAPELDFEFEMIAGEEEMDLNDSYDATERVSLFLADGETLRGERYRVPGFTCLRADDTEWNDLPEAAEAPGGAAVFEVLYPPEGAENGALVFMPHGDGFEFIEAMALEAWKLVPDLAEMYGVHPEHGTRGVEQSTSEGARRNLVSTTRGRAAIVLARLGAVVVLPGNCWGDGGYGTGRDGDGYYDGPRDGGTFDHEAWTWARANLDHEDGKRVAFGCSGGGHRIAQELIRDNDAFTAAVIDSPADDTSKFIEPPMPEILAAAWTILRSEKFDELMTEFYEGTYGGLEEAEATSLGANLPGSSITAPIYLIYSTGDTTVTPQIVAPLASAVDDLDDPSTVVTVDEAVHCQINTDERMQAATDWLADVVGF